MYFQINEQKVHKNPTVKQIHFEIMQHAHKLQVNKKNLTVSRNCMFHYHCPSSDTTLFFKQETLIKYHFHKSFLEEFG